jgi:hypothetical protein
VFLVGNRCALTVEIGSCRILKGVRGALQEELSDFLEIRGTWSYIQEKS